MQPAASAPNLPPAAARAIGVRLLVAACGCVPLLAAAQSAASPTVAEPGVPRQATSPPLPSGPSAASPSVLQSGPAGAAASSAASADAASAGEFPRRRPGLWEVDTVGAQAAGLPAAQYCVDETTDRAALHLDRTAGTKGACRFGAFQRVADGWVAETVCREGRSVVTTRSVATGDFQASYRIDTLITYEPPLGGFRREERTATVGRRLGACLPGQTGGDVAIPGMGRINMQNGSVVADEPDPKARRRRAPKQQADG